MLVFLHTTENGDITLVTSASDLTAASNCEFAFLRRVDHTLGRNIDVPKNDDEMMQRTARLGDLHEERVLAEYEARYGTSTETSGRTGVMRIARAQNLDAAALRIAQEHTLTALASKADIVFQATFYDPAQRPAQGEDPAIGFVGYADFLQLMPDGSYQVQDSKLARRAKVTALMQLAAYAEQLERLEVSVWGEAVLILGDAVRSAHQLHEIAPVFRARRERLHELLLARARARGDDGQRQSAPAIAWGAPGIVACGRCEVCEPEVISHRDPLLIAGIQTRARNALIAAGITTIDQVADNGQRIRTGELSVTGVSQDVLANLALQAQQQLAAEPGKPPPYVVHNPQALAALPAPNAGDLFFDFEGDPLYREGDSVEDSRWGIDYLFGMVDVAEQFTPIWAHELEAERAALLQFLELVQQRRAEFAGMKIYHYASYERTHLLSIAARHGVGEQQVDQLLRENVLVDLYPIVRSALRVGSRSYSIKKLEPLYMGDELRNEDGVTNAAQSVTEYAVARELTHSDDPQLRASGKAKLEAIADYNRYDCVSTLRLRDWLRELATAHGIEPAMPVPSSRETDTEIVLSPTATKLTELGKNIADDVTAKAAAIAASAIDYHEREQKSFWWAHYDRLVAPLEDWADTRGVVVIDHQHSFVETDWVEPTGRARNFKRRLFIRGTVAPGSNLKPDTDVYLVYENPVPFDFVPSSSGARAARQATIIEVHVDGIVVEESRKPDTPAWQALPAAITPGPPPRAGAQKGAIEEWGEHIAEELKAGKTIRDPAFDVLLKNTPQLSNQMALVSVNSPEALSHGGSDEARTIGAVIASLLALQNSTIGVQGPPGTGKTYLAARVIRKLVEEHHWHIGVVAQSHAVVENVLEGVVAAGLNPEQVGKVAQQGSQPEDLVGAGFTWVKSNGHQQFTTGHRSAGRGCVIGGTAWDFSNAERFGRKSLDLIVIDEAGQFSLAPTIAVSVAARNLLLLGDPQQLPQVSQGTHPEPVDTSALGWLIGEHETLPAEMGYFLAETRRMRPELAEIVSELSYDGRLHAHPSTLKRNIRDAGPPGLLWHPVDHHGNSTSSVEEADAVVHIVQKTLSGHLTEHPDPERQLTQSDVIVIAPYNAHVEAITQALHTAGLNRIRVGTVDKFQGQEAAVAIVSLAASSPEDAPRGLEFLLLRNRLNVAISRGQWCAHLVSSPALSSALPHTVEGLTSLSSYLRLNERAQHTPICLE